MKKLVILLLLFISTTALAIEAIVTVLNAPLFLEEDINSKVTDYLPKGTKIQINKKDTTRSDLLDLEEDLHYEMPHLKKMELSDSKFYPVYNRKGHEAFILKKHLYVYFESTKELTSKAIAKDGTDYRLEEPLSEIYPLKSPQWKRAWGALGFGTLQRDEYNFGSNNLQTYGSRFDMSFAYAERALIPQNERLYFGVMGNFHYGSKAFTFDDRTASEKWMVFGFGPYLSFDPWKGEKSRFTIYTAVLADLLSTINISQQDDTNIEDASFKTINIRPKIGAFYSWSNVLNEIDPMIGFEAQSVRSVFSTQSQMNKASGWWQSNQLDKKVGIEISIFFGIQKRI